MIQLTGLWAVIAILITGIVIVTVIMIIFKKISALEVSKDGVKFNNIRGQNLSQMISLLYSKHSEYYFKRRQLEDSILRDQMNYAEQKCETLREFFLNDYLDILCEKSKDKTNANLIKSDDYLSNVNMMYRVMIEIKNTFRTILKENHLDLKNELEWNKYKREKKEFLGTKIKKMIDVCYLTGCIISLSELQKRLYPKFTRVFSDEVCEILDEAKRISVDTQKLLENQENDFKAELEALCTSI